MNHDESCKRYGELIVTNLQPIFVTAPHDRKHLSRVYKDKTTMVLSLTAIHDMLSVIYISFEHVSK